MPTPDRFSDLRVLRWFDRIDGALAGEQVGPIRANLDLTNLCSHNCFFCEPVAYRKETISDKNHTLQYNVALEVLHDLKEMDCRTLNLSGGGEPTLHPQFGLILRAAANLGFRTWIVTHGGLIHKWYDELLLADHVRISLDASNPEEHRLMHGHGEGQFERIWCNIKELCKRRVNGSPEIGVAYILADCNDKPDSLQRVYQFCCDAGVDFIHFRPLSEEGERQRGSKWPIETLKWCEDNLQGSTKVFGLGKRYAEVFHNRDFDTCYSAFTLAVIGADGNVQACCDRRDISFGNCNVQSFKSIWLSARHRAMAEAIVPKLCTRCLQANYNRAVERFIVGNETLPELL